MKKNTEDFLGIVLPILIFFVAVPLLMYFMGFLLSKL